mmetsp:Transcript_20788/g.57475  ORF Transcript_20788/g.57475 Transcript_20788/m.57475 type:complete len:292 (+) Transcript_20788:53-928(+)
MTRRQPPPNQNDTTLQPRVLLGFHRIFHHDGSRKIQQARAGIMTDVRNVKRPIPPLGRVLLQFGPPLLHFVVQVNVVQQQQALKRKAAQAFQKGSFERRRPGLVVRVERNEPRAHQGGKILRRYLQEADIFELNRSDDARCLPHRVNPGWLRSTAKGQATFRRSGQIHRHHHVSGGRGQGQTAGHESRPHVHQMTAIGSSVRRCQVMQQGVMFPTRRTGQERFVRRFGESLHLLEAGMGRRTQSRSAQDYSIGGRFRAPVQGTVGRQGDFGIRVGRKIPGLWLWFWLCLCY